MKKGDRVVLRPGTRYYKVNTRNNPAAVEGVITHAGKLGEHPVNVDWDNGGHNCYGYDDLIYVDENYTPYEKRII